MFGLGTEDDDGEKATVRPTTSPKPTTAPVNAIDDGLTADCKCTRRSVGTSRSSNKTGNPYWSHTMPNGESCVLETNYESNFSRNSIIEGIRAKKDRSLST
jgi:hypothetical protein